jgi:hypothetical protein
MSDTMKILEKATQAISLKMPRIVAIAVADSRRLRAK